MLVNEQVKSSRWQSREALFEYLRRQMVEEQLRARGIDDERVLRAMGEVPREQFIPCQEEDLAYEDLPIALGGGQTLPRPYTVALMCQLLRLQPVESVLEIGTGTGYTAAVLSHLARRVVSLAHDPSWAKQARERMERLGYANVTIEQAEAAGTPPPERFDAILVSPVCETLPTAYLQQLSDAGRLVVPLGDCACGEALYRFAWRGGRLDCEQFGACALTPWIAARGVSDLQWS